MTNKTEISIFQKLINESYSIPYIQPKTFLKKIYNINSFFDCVQWIKDNPKTNYLTLYRILNVSIQSYNIDINITEPIIIKLLTKFLTTHLKLISKKSKLDSELIKKQYLNINFITKFIQHILNSNHNKLDLEIIRDLFIKYIIK